MHSVRLLSFLALVLSCSLLWADEKTEPYRDTQTGIDFPAMLGGLPRREVETFKQAALGVGIRYAQGTSLRADVIVYDGGVKQIGSGVESKAIKDHFKTLSGNLSEFEKRGIYKGVKEVASGEEKITTPHGDVAFLHDSHSFTQLVRPKDDTYDGLRVSHTYLAGYKDKFIKVRFTYPETEKEASEEALKKFMTELAGLMKP